MRRRRALHGLSEEIADHIARETQDNIDRGMTPEEARRQAMLKFGNVAAAAEDTRVVWGRPSLDTLRQDLRYARRTLRQNPAFAAVVVLTLGFGIGTTTATFSIVNAALIRPLAFAEPERLVALHERIGDAGIGGGNSFSPPDFLDLARDQQSFDGVAAYLNLFVEMSDGADPVRVSAARVSWNLFSVLGATPALGRVFTADEDRPGADVAILSWRLWQTRYRGDHSIVGQMVTLDRRPYTVIGVMPEAFEFPVRGAEVNNTPAGVWVPLVFTQGQRLGRGNGFSYSVVGRMAPGVSLETAGRELDLLTARINAAYPSDLRNANFSVRLYAVPLREEVAGGVQRPLLLIFAAVGLVLLVTCANVANLMLSRAASRSREVAVRVALGASRSRLMQLLLAEALILSAAGGLLGLLSSSVIVSVVPSVVADRIPMIEHLTIDLRVLAFTAGLALATSIVMALIPLTTDDRAAGAPPLQESTSRVTANVRRHRLQAGLVVSTVMLAFVLLVSAGLFIRSITALLTTDAGFEPDQVLSASLTLPRAGYPTAAHVRTFHQALLTRASSMTGVRSAALVTDLPLENYDRRVVSAERIDRTDGTNVSWVYGPFVQTLGIQLKRGRTFSDDEILSPRQVVVVNERLAQRFWPGEDAIGKRLRWGINSPQNRNPWLTIIGVVADVADGPLGTLPFIHAYEPFSQLPDLVLNNIPGAFGRHVKVAVRTEGDPRGFALALRKEIADVDPQLAIQSMATMGDRIGEDVAPRRFSALTLSAFAMSSLGLAAIGLHGLLAFNVRERRREIAVRVALGAQPSGVVRMIISQGLTLVAIGVATGAVVSYGVARWVASFLYRIESHDAVTFGAATIVLAVIASLACAWPAYRASRVDPVAILRSN